MSQSSRGFARVWRAHALWGGAAFCVLLALGVASGSAGAPSSTRALRGIAGIGYLLLFAALVIVPLGVALASAPGRDGRQSRLYVGAAVLHPIAVGCAIAALLSAQGARAGWLAAPYVVETLLLAGFSLSARLAAHGLVSLEELAIDAALLYLPVGAAWWLATCAGLSLGFDVLIVQLTAVHFHYAGFAAPLCVGLLGRALPARRAALSRRVYRVACPAVLLGVWIVAAGIAISPLAEIIGAVLLASAMCATAALLLVSAAPRAISTASAAHAEARELATRTAARVSTLLLALAGLALALPMVLAVVYAVGEYTHRPLIIITEMARWHGYLNAFGFAFAALLAFTLREPPSRLRPPAPPLSRLRGGWHIGADYFERSGLSRADAGASVRGIVDALEAYRHARFDPSRVAPAVRDFYERTAAFEIAVHARWRFGFRTAARLVMRIARRIGQLDLPLDRAAASTHAAAEANAVTRPMTSVISALDSRADGREDVRSWVRTRTEDNTPIYVAAYSTHHDVEARGYMNIAFPLPGGNLTSILRMQHVDGAPGALCLTTRPDDDGRVRDEGVYYVRWSRRAAPRSRPRLLRLPLDETVSVYPRDEAPADLHARFGDVAPDCALARHVMRLAGIEYLTLDYLLGPTAGPHTDEEHRTP